MATEESLILAPAASTVSVGPIVFSKAEVPYLMEWFGDVKKEGEDAPQFVERILKEIALRHRYTKLTTLNINEHDEEKTTYHSAISEEFATLSDAI